MTPARSLIVALVLTMTACGSSSDSTTSTRVVSATTPSITTSSASVSPSANSPTDRPTLTNEDVPGPAERPDLQNVPLAAAPLQLSTAVLPTDPTAIAAVWTQLPSEIARYARFPPGDQAVGGRLLIGYGEDRRLGNISGPLVALQAIHIPQTNFYPTNWNAAHVVAATLAHDLNTGDDPTFTEGGKDGELFWMRGETAIGVAGLNERFPLYMLQWGTSDSPWIFGAQADTPEHLDAVVEAFVGAVNNDRSDAQDRLRD